MNKLHKTIIFTSIVLLSFIFGALIVKLFFTISTSNTCYYTVDKATVTSVYFTPDSFGNDEHWRGFAIDEKGNKIEYEVRHPVEIGSTIKAKRGCGYYNQPF